MVLCLHRNARKSRQLISSILKTTVCVHRIHRGTLISTAIRARCTGHHYKRSYLCKGRNFPTTVCLCRQQSNLRKPGLGSNWPCGPMDKALDYESRDCRFESCQGRFYFLQKWQDIIRFGIGTFYLTEIPVLRNYVFLPRGAVFALISAHTSILVLILQK